MKQKNPIDKTALACAFAVLLFIIAGSQSLAQTGTPDSVPGSPVILVAEDRYFPVRVPAPPLKMRDGTVPNAVNFVPFDVDYNAASCGDAVDPWPTNARTAFGYAAAIWATLLNGTRTIHIDACWRTDMVSPTLGSARATRFYTNFANAPVKATFYTVALANQLSGQDWNGAEAEIHADFNSNYTWYRGTDGNTPDGQHDLVTVVLHEIGHGLGFSGSMRWDDGEEDDDAENYEECNGTEGTGCWGVDTYGKRKNDGTGLPKAYDRFTQNGSGKKLLSYDNISTTLGTQLVSGSLFFSGTKTIATNDNSPAKLYAPDPWEPGSSYSHLDDIYNGTWNALMTSGLARGESAHHPGAIALGILADIGWNIPNMANTYVDYNNTGNENGTSVQPFNTVIEGVNAVRTFGQLWIRPGTYRENIFIRRPMKLSRWGSSGVVVIGDP